MDKVYDLAVVGGGAIGASIAWEAAARGMRVAVLERGRMCGGASRVAAGMIGAQLEFHRPGPLYHWALESRARYPGFAERLFEETGVDAEYSQTGILRVAGDGEEGEGLRELGNWQSGLGQRAQWLSPSEAREMEPALGEGAGALWLPDDGNVSVPRLADALAAAARKRCAVFEGSEVREISTDGEGVRVATQDRATLADRAVIATGAWAGPLRPGARLAVGPVKGQVMTVRPRGGNTLGKTVFSAHGYFVPKRDGTIVVGATAEPDAGFSPEVTVGAVRRLAEGMARVLPGLGDAVLEGVRAGFRPCPGDGRPVMGPDPENPRIWHARGHCRNGILLAPVVASWMADLLLGTDVSDLKRTFFPGGEAS